MKHLRLPPLSQDAGTGPATCRYPEYTSNVKLASKPGMLVTLSASGAPRSDVKRKVVVVASAIVRRGTQG